MSHFICRGMKYSIRWLALGEIWTWISLRNDHIPTGFDQFQKFAFSKNSSLHFFIINFYFPKHAMKIANFSLWKVRTSVSTFGKNEILKIIFLKENLQTWFIPVGTRWIVFWNFNTSKTWFSIFCFSFLERDLGANYREKNLQPT